MDINKYFKLLSEHKLDEARETRMATIPEKLIKFVWLNDDDSDEKRFTSLKNNEIWFSHKRYLNDPYEFKGMLVDRAKFVEAGYPEDVIDKYQTLFEFDDYGITCLSANEIDYLPMWAYYTNNHKGFCIEYEVIKKDCIYEVLYEPERIKVASLLFQCKEAVRKAIQGSDKKQADIYSAIFLQNLFIKAKAWEHEKEYRIVYPIGAKKGENIPAYMLGMKVSRIVAGINCSEKNIERLDKISNSLDLGNAYKSCIHPEKYTIEVFR